jgi:hypothetical protein
VELDDDEGREISQQLRDAIKRDLQNRRGRL